MNHGLTCGSRYTGFLINSEFILRSSFTLSIEHFTDKAPNTFLIFCYPAPPAGHYPTSIYFAVPHTRLITKGDRAFESMAPSLWNALPAHIQSEISLTVFKKNLKTHLFKLALQ